MNTTIAALFEQLLPEQAKIVNRICDQFEQSCRRGEIPQLDEWLNSVAPDLRLVALHELVLVDVLYRHPKPTHSLLDGYCRRFSGLDVHWLSQQLGLNVVVDESTISPQDAWSDLEAGPTHKTLDRIGKFELQRQIGHGGMGIVYQAFQTDLNRTVALKTLTKLVARNAEARNRFRAEVESVARVHHPHIVQIYEVGLEDGTPYYSMEFVEGGNLSELTRSHPLAPKSAAKLVSFVARAIHYAHSCGVIHRDLKPGNILLAPSQQQDGIRLSPKNSSQTTNSGFTEFYEPKIADFGLAKRLDADNQDTLQGVALGTPSYMSPEQAAGLSPIGPTSDIYSLGAVLYDLLISRPPFHASTPAETIQQVLNDEPVPLRKMRSDVPVDLETICLKCLAKEPAKRYETAQELAEDLGRFLDGKPIHARRASWMERLGKSIKRHPAIAALWLTLVLGIAGTTWQWQTAEANRIVANEFAQSADAAHRRETVERDRVERTLYAHDITLANFEYQSNHVQRARDLLTQAPSQLRHWEWAFIKHRVERGYKDLHTFDMAARAVAISPDGKRIASCSGVWGKPDQGEIRVWNRETGELLWLKREHPGPVMDLNFDPSGQKLISSGVRFVGGKTDGGVIVWNASSGEMLWHEPNLEAQAAMFSRDGHDCIIGTYKGVINIRSAETGEPLRQWSAHKGYISDLSSWEDGKCLVSSSIDGFMRVWDYADGKLLDEDKFNSPDRVTCSIDGKSIAACSHYGELKCYEFDEDGLELKFKRELGERIGALQYSADGQYLITSVLNQPIRFIDFNNGQTLLELYGHDGNTAEAVQSADGCFVASCGSDGTIKSWDLAAPEGFVNHTVGGPFIIDVEFLPDSQFVALAMALNPGNKAREFSVKIWDFANSKIVRHLMGHTDWLTSVAIDQQSQTILSGSNDKSARLWSLSDWSCLRTFDSHDSPVVDVAYTSGEKVITAESNGRIHVWDRDSGKAVAEWDLPENDCTHIAALRSSDFIAAASKSGKIWLYRVGAPEPIRQMATEPAQITELVFSPDGEKLAVARSNASINIWDTKQLAITNSLVTPVKIVGSTGAVHDICFSPDNRRIVSCGSDRALKLWDTKTGSEVFSIPNAGLHGRFNRVAFSPDGTTIWQSDQNVAETWSVAPRPIDYVRWHTKEANKSQSNRNWHGASLHRAALTSLRPSDAQEFVQYGNALAETGRYDEAITAYQTALKLVPQRHIGNERLLSLLLLQQSRFKELRNVRTAMLTEFGQSTNATDLNTLAWTFAFGAQSTDALSLIPIAEKAAASKHTGAFNTLGAIYLRSGRIADAIAALNSSRASSRNKDGGIFDWLLLSIAYSKLENFEEARKWLDKSEYYLSQIKHQQSSRAPDSWSVRFEIQWLLEEAIQLCPTTGLND